MLAIQEPNIETCSAYYLWMLTCPRCTIKTEGVGGSDLQNFALIHTHLALLPQSLSMRFSIFTAIVVAIGRFIQVQWVFFVEHA